MRPTTLRRHSGIVGRASRSPARRVLARSGLAARGVLYILIGWVAILVAHGQTSRHANQQGALQLLAAEPYGLVSLWLLAIGFAGYALWRLSEAAAGTPGDRKAAGPRLLSFGRAVVYAALAYLTFEIIIGAGGSQSRRQRDVTGKLMHHAGGRVLVGIAGVIIVAIGVTLLAEGLHRKFLKHLRMRGLGPRGRRLVELLGVVGITARGVVFALAGALVIDAAVTHRPGQASGLDKALLTLRDQPFGEFLLILAAIGLIIFGVYGLCEARWRRV